MSSSEILGKQVINKLTEVLENYSNYVIFWINFLVHQPFVEIWQERAYDLPELLPKQNTKLPTVSSSSNEEQA